MNGRRTFLSTTLKAAGGFAPGPALVRQDRARPGIPYGAVSGDVTRDRAIVWSCSDRPARMLVEWATTDGTTVGSRQSSVFSRQSVVSVDSR